jgi:hypothetical protein
VIILKQITIRGIPVEIEKLIKEEAEKKGVSLNKAFLSLLMKATGLKGEGKKKKILYHDLDHLSGAWTKEDSTMFEKKLKLLRKIDEEIWKKER